MVIAISDSLLSDYQGARNVMGGLLTPPSDYQSFSAPLSNKGNPTSKVNKTDNTFAVPSNTPVRLVDSSTGKVVYEGVGFDATQQAIAAAQGLTDSKGKKAAWQIQIAPGAGTTWSTVAQEKKNKSVLGKIADVALPVVGGILGGPLGAAAGSAASSVAQGRSLENTLLRAAIAGGTSALVPGGKSPVSAGGGGGAGTAGLTGAGLAEGASLAPGALASLPANLAAIQTGANAALAGAGLGAGAAGAAGAAGGVLASTAPAAAEAAPLIITAPTATSVLPEVAALTAAGTTAAATSGSSAANAASDAAISQNTQSAIDTAYQNAQAGAASDLAAAGYSGMGAGAFVAPGAGATVGSGILGTGLSATQLATLGSLGLSGLNSLFGGGSGGGTGTGTPYVSALGAMPNFTPRTQINPNITDYERYGFGPEALFFSGGQALNTYTPPAATTPAQTTTPTAAPAATTPAATTTNLLDSAAGGVIATPENTGMTQERLDSLQSRYENMRSGDFFNYFKAVNDVLGNYAAKGIITPDIAKQYQSRLETAASVPNATLATLQAAVPMPQISDFLTPTGTQQPVEQQPAPQTQMTYTPPAEPITDPNRYVNDLFKQIGAQYSQGLLSIDQARNIQQQLQSAQKQFAPVDRLQSIYNTALQQYRPLI